MLSAIFVLTYFFGYSFSVLAVPFIFDINEKTKLKFGIQLWSSDVDFVDLYLSSNAYA